MDCQISKLGNAARFGFNLLLALALFGIPGQRLYAVDCSVVTHPHPSDADKALQSADFAKAADLYRGELTKHPGDEDLTAGLVHALLRQQKVQEASEAVTASLTARANSPALLTLRGEVEFRQGMPWAAAESANQAVRIDPCNSRTHLLLSRIARLSSLYATQRKQIQFAYTLDPADPEIRDARTQTLPTSERISELENYLTNPGADDPKEIILMHAYLDRLKKQAESAQKSCRLVSQTAATEIPFIYLMNDATHIRAFGLEVKLNDHAARLQIDTGAGGLVVSRSVAERAGLKADSKIEMGGIGDQGVKSGYTAFADSIRIGGLEFQNCAVQVLDSKDVVDVDGLVGMDVFSNFLVTLDYPMRKVALGPLPPRPGESAAAPVSLKTNTESEEDEDSAEQATGAPQSQAQAAAPKAAPRGPFDRYIAPEMKDYSAIYRVGHDLLIPAQLNGQKIKLFILDTGSFATSISPEAASEVSTIHRDRSMEIKGIEGSVNKAYFVSDLTFRFAHISQRIEGAPAFDTSRISRSVGMEVSGFLGATTLGLLTTHIDYRDGLVKFDYDASKGYLPRALNQ
jgi:predicted aspartyl protease